MDSRQDGLIDVRPLPVCVIGVTGHRQNSGIDAHAAAIAANIQGILTRLRLGVISVCAGSKFLYPTTPVLRVVGMAAEGADLIAMKAAYDLGIPVACVLPFPIEEYRRDIADTPSLGLFDEMMAASESQFELPGIRGEGARSYERANDVIISNCDLLIAVWDGMEARGRAGTGDVVQQAFEREIPIVVIDPASPTESQLLVKSRDQAVEGMRALESERKRLPDDLSDLAGTLLTPPRLRGSQRILEDLYAEKKTTRSFRFEYALLLRIFGASRARKQGLQFDEQLAWKKARETALLCDQEWPARIDSIWDVIPVQQRERLFSGDLDFPVVRNPRHFDPFDLDRHAHRAGDRGCAHPSGSMGWHAPALAGKVADLSLHVRAPQGPALFAGVWAKLAFRAR
jgi:hypothetical protein